VGAVLRLIQTGPRLISAGAAAQRSADPDALSFWPPPPFRAFWPWLRRRRPDPRRWSRRD